MHGHNGPFIVIIAGDKLNGHVTDNVNCLIIIIAKDDNNIASVQLKIKHFDFFC